MPYISSIDKAKWVNPQLVEFLQAPTIYANGGVARSARAPGMVQLTLWEDIEAVVNGGEPENRIAVRVMIPISAALCIVEQIEAIVQQLRKDADIGDVGGLIAAVTIGATQALHVFPAICALVNGCLSA